MLSSPDKSSLDPLGKVKVDIEKLSSSENLNKYVLNKESFDTLLGLAYRCEIPSTKCRWTIWRKFLKAIPDGSEAEIRKAVKQARDFYKEKIASHAKARKQQAEMDDPLSRGSGNAWNSFQEDNDLRNSIKIDVDRTYQDLEFFTDPTVKEVLNNVLFVWSKLNPAPSYRQGMNELAAMLTWACFQENVEVSDEKDADSDLYKFLNNQKYAEADIYAAFSRLMAVGQKDMFDNNSPAKNNPTLVELMKPKIKALNLILSGLQADPSKPASAILSRATMIQEYWLEIADEELYRHLKRLRVEPQIYALRWIRCMLSREYKMPEAMLLWDVTFAHYYFNNPKASIFDMLDYLVLAMLLFVKKDLMSKDDGGYCLQRLLKYPPVQNISEIIALAVKAREKVIAAESAEISLPTRVDPLAGNLFTTPLSKPTPKTNTQDIDPLRNNSKPTTTQSSKPTTTTTSTTSMSGDAPIFFNAGYSKPSSTGSISSTNNTTAKNTSNVSKNDNPLQKEAHSHIHTSNSTPQLHSKENGNDGENTIAINKILEVIGTLEKELILEKNNNIEYSVKELKAAVALLQEAGKYKEAPKSKGGHLFENHLSFK